MTPRSACVFCPFKSPEEWERTSQTEQDWNRAVQIDGALRTQGTVANRGMVAEMYVHRSCKPLTEVDLKADADRARDRKSLPLFEQLGCGDGLCGV